MATDNQSPEVDANEYANGLRINANVFRAGLKDGRSDGRARQLEQSANLLESQAAKIAELEQSTRELNNAVEAMNLRELRSVPPTNDDKLIFALHDTAREVIEQYEHRFAAHGIGKLYGPIDDAITAMREAFAKMTIAAIQPPHEPAAVQSTDLLLQPESKEPATVLPDGMITVPKGHFWRGEINRFYCRNCGKHHDQHIHSNEASLCPRETGGSHGS